MNIIKSADYVPPSERNMNGHHHYHFNHNLSHQRQQQQGCGRSHDPAIRSAAAAAAAGSGGEWEQQQQPQQNSVNGRAKRIVPTLTRNVHDAKRNERKTTRSSEMEDKQKYHSRTVEEKLRTNIPCPKLNGTKVKTGQSGQKGQIYQRGVTQRPPPSVVKGFVGYQSGTACYVGASVVGQENGGVFGVYSETKYTFAVNGLPGNPAQTSAAAAFFAR